MIACLSHHAALEISYFLLISFLFFPIFWGGKRLIWISLLKIVNVSLTKPFIALLNYRVTFMSDEFNGSLIPSNAQLMAKLPPLSNECLFELAPFNQSILALCLAFLLVSSVDLIIKQFSHLLSFRYLSWKPCCLLDFFLIL